MLCLMHFFGGNATTTDSGIIFSEMCFDISMRLIEMLCFYQIEAGSKIFNNINFESTFCVKYNMLARPQQFP